MERLLEGDGTKNHPFFVRDLGGKRVESRCLQDILSQCNRSGISKLKIAYSGRHYERRPDGWYNTTDYAHCRPYHGLPEVGVKVSG